MKTTIENIKKIKELCKSINNLENSIESVMRENNDTEITHLIYDECSSKSRGDLNSTFIAYSENYIYILERTVIGWSDGETKTRITAIPRNPTENQSPLWYGGWS